jgi:hypothetical protein
MIVGSLGRMTELTELGLLPAEHRALRELHVSARQMQAHWNRLADRLGGPPAEYLREGAALAAELLTELDGATELQYQPAAEGVGARLGGARGLSDLLLERNQAFRTALLELQHLTTLAGYLSGLARSRGDEALAGRHDGWADRLRPLEERGRAIAVTLANDPEAAIAPADNGVLGRAGQHINAAAGSLGEAIDHSPLGRFARRGQ